MASRNEWPFEFAKHLIGADADIFTMQVQALRAEFLREVRRRRKPKNSAAMVAALDQLDNVLRTLGTAFVLCANINVGYYVRTGGGQKR